MKIKTGKIILAVLTIFLAISFTNVHAAGTPTVTISPNSSTIAPGTNIVVSGSNFPTGSGLTISVNNVKQAALFPDPSGNISTTISSSDPSINSSGSNTISFTAQNVLNNPIQVNGSPLTFSISTTGLTGATTPAPTTNCATASPGTPNCVFNPLPTGDLVTFILLLMKWLLGVIGIFAVLFIMIGGFRMITSQGNEEAYGVAKKTVTYAVIGLVVAVLSFSMIAIVENLLQANISTNPITNQSSS